MIFGAGRAKPGRFMWNFSCGPAICKSLFKRNNLRGRLVRCIYSVLMMRMPSLDFTTSVIPNISGYQICRSALISFTSILEIFVFEWQHLKI
jgi:hypothetical protein